MRISRVAILVALLGGCNRPTTVDVPEADRIECAVGNSEAFVRDCFIERGPETGSLTLHHADGGFRRLSTAADGSVSTADGADAATTTRLTDGSVEIRVGENRYRLPVGK